MVADALPKPLMPPRAPCSQPLKTPPESEDLHGFMLPPPATESYDDIFNLDFVIPRSTVEASPIGLGFPWNEDCNAGAPKMGALLFQAMKALIPNDGEVSRQDLPKEVTCLPPKAPLLRPSVQSTWDINEIPNLVLPDAADVDLFDELEEIRPKFSVKAKGIQTSLEKVHQNTCKSILSVLASEEAGQKGFAELSERWSAAAADGRRRTSTCSTVASMTDLEPQRRECSMTKLQASSMVKLTHSECVFTSPVSL
ncbi:unnamed protein product [Symbiodinium sp. CCMP2456]|nr:unnamed protein product [Symbiodinium sp. CCMP2456]